MKNWPCPLLAEASIRAKGLNYDTIVSYRAALPPSNTEDMDALSGVVAGLISGGMSFG